MAHLLQDFQFNAGNPFFMKIAKSDGKKISTKFQITNINRKFNPSSTHK